MRFDNPGLLNLIFSNSSAKHRRKVLSLIYSFCVKFMILLRTLQNKIHIIFYHQLKGVLFLCGLMKSF